MDAIKKIVASRPVLKTFDPEKPTTVKADASDKAMGAELSQPDDQGKMHPVAFFSKKFSPAELNYNIYNKELLAIVSAFKI